MKTLFVKSLVASAAALALSSSALMAEESGAFVGVGVGYGGAKSTLESGTPGNLDTTKLTATGGMRYELIAGYKQFFTQSFGLRYYGNFSYGDNSFTYDTKLASSVMNYGVNVDALYNFVSNETMDFGAFLGVGVGANTWGGKYIDSLNDETKVELNKSVSSTGLDVALNVGVRALFAKHHGVEIAARVPFVATTLINSTLDGYKMNYTIAPAYNVSARYTFNF